MEQQSITSETAMESLAPLEKLESRIHNAIDQVRIARRQQAAAESEVKRLNELLAQREEEIERLTAELAEHRSERRQVRERIENLLEKIDNLTAA